MNIKYLKKLRKHFDWYINDSGWPVVLDLKLEAVTIYTPLRNETIRKHIEDFMREPTDYKEPKQFAWTLARKQMYNNAGIPFAKIRDRQTFRKARKKRRSGKNFSLKTTTDD